MFRWILILLVLGVVAFAAGWLAEHPGSVTLEWMGYRVTESVAVLFVQVVIIAGVAALLYRL